MRYFFYPGFNVYKQFYILRKLCFVFSFMKLGPPSVCSIVCVMWHPHDHQETGLPNRVAKTPVLVKSTVVFMFWPVCVHCLLSHSCKYDPVVSSWLLNWLSSLVKPRLGLIITSSPASYPPGSTIKLCK